MYFRVARLKSVGRSRSYPYLFNAPGSKLSIGAPHTLGRSLLDASKHSVRQLLSRSLKYSTDASAASTAASSNYNEFIGPQAHIGNPTNENCDDADELFQKELQGMSKISLGGLDVMNYTKRQRRLINEERVRRNALKKAAAQNNGTSAPASEKGQTSSKASPNAKKPKKPTRPQIPGPGISGDNASQSSKEPPKVWYHFPELHDLIAQQVPTARFEDSDENGIQEWLTNNVATFKCSNEACNRTWTSGIVATIIRRYELCDNKIGYNAKLFNQCCIKCHSLGRMKLSWGGAGKETKQAHQGYVGIVVRRLKIWRGEPVDELPEYENETEPHKDWLCEGCKAGRCPKSSPISR
ncbi:hypothetical protein TWF481_003171 [Arthrobotrys musiformis]|uniref:3CxxC-type domain-containing protein n=1 Tax=Arthrobotrys musiformis TaxID=47236 RepID=A0AAV9VPR3_9PEZI